MEDTCMHGLAACIKSYVYQREMHICVLEHIVCSAYTRLLSSCCIKIVGVPGTWRDVRT
jgi:hypothetical protein